MAKSKPKGLVEPGNIDLYNRPEVRNPDGSVSTVRSMSFSEDGREILIPTVVGNKVVSDQEAIDEYHRTGKHLGMFDTPENANAYAQNLHNQYATGRYKSIESIMGELDQPSIDSIMGELDKPADVAPSPTPIKADTEKVFQPIDIVNPNQLQLSPEDRDYLQREGELEGLRSLTPELKETIAKRFIDDQKKLHAYDPDVLLKNSWEDMKGIFTGIGEGLGTVASGLWDSYKKARDYDPQKLQAEGEDLKGDLTTGNFDLEGLKKRLAVMGKTEPVFDEHGGFVGVRPIPEMPVGKKFEKGLETVYQPQIDAFKKIQSGDIKGGLLDLGDHYAQHPVDLLFDGSMAFGITGSAIEKLGVGLQAASKAGWALNTADKLADVGKGLEIAGKAIDPLQLATRAAKPVAQLVGKVPFKGSTIGEWIQLRQYVNGVFQDGFKEMSARLMDDKDKIKSIFGDLSTPEIEAFSANLEGLALPLKPTAQFQKALDTYRQWMALEDKYLTDAGKLSSSQIRSVVYQPIMSATGLSLAELQDLVERTSSGTVKMSDTMKGVESAIKGEELVSSDAKTAADVAQKAPDVAAMSRKRQDFTKALQTGPLSTRDTAAEAINQMDREIQKGVGKSPMPLAPGTVDDMVRIARVDPHAADLYSKLSDEERMWNDYATRLQKKQALIKKAPAPRNVMVEEIRKLKTEFDSLVDQAKGETSSSPERLPSLTTEEKASQTGVHRTPKRSFLRRMASYDVSDTDARTLFEVSSGPNVPGSASVEQTIRDIADRTAAAKYGEQYTSLDQDTKEIAKDAIAEQLKEELVGIRAPVERGEKFLSVTSETRQQLSDRVYKMHRLAYELDRFAPTGAATNAYDRVSSYTNRALDEPLINPRHGEVYEYQTKTGAVKREYKPSPIWEKGEARFKKYKKYTRRANPQTLGKRERLDNMATANARLNELAAAKKHILDTADSYAKGYQSTFNLPNIDTDADAVIASNLEADAADTINKKSWMVNTMDKNIAMGSPYNTPQMVDEAHARAMKASNVDQLRDFQRVRDSYNSAIDDLHRERNRIVRTKSVTPSPTTSASYSFPKGVIKEGEIDKNALDAVIGKMIDRSNELRKAGQPGAEAIITDIKTLQDQATAYRAASREIKNIDKRIALYKGRLESLYGGGRINPEDLPAEASKPGTTQPPSPGEKMAPGPSEAAPPAPGAPKPTPVKVPKILSDVMKKDVADPRAIIGQLSMKVRNDPDLMKALNRVRDYATGRGVDITVGPNEAFNLDRIKVMMMEAHVPRAVRIQARQVLDAYNQARAFMEPAEEAPFVAQQILRREVMTKDDLVRGALQSSREAKFTEPVYYPHQWEHNVNILDGRAPIGKQILSNVRQSMEGRPDATLTNELYHAGYTGYYLENGEFVPITHGKGIRNTISGLFNRTDAVAKAPLKIGKPAFLRKRTGAWGYITNDPESVMTIHRQQFRDYQRKIEMLNTMENHPDVAELKDPINLSDLKPGNVPFSFEGVRGYYNKSISFKKLVDKAVRDSGGSSDEAMLNALKNHLPNDLTTGPIPTGMKIVQIPVGMRDAIIANVKADLPPNWVRLVIDKPTNFFRGMVLALNPHFWMNHILGHTLLNTLGGVSPIDYIMAKHRMFDDVFPSEVYTNSFYRMESRESAATFSSKKAFTKMYNVIGNVDKFYREAAYVHFGKDIARKEGMLKSIYSAYDANDLVNALKQVKDDPVLRERAMQAVNEWQFDYTKLDPFERTWVRRIFPFWSFYRNITKNFYMMPLKHPMKAYVFKSLAEVGHEAARQRVQEMGIDYGDLSRFLEGKVVLPGDKGMISTRAFNPYQDVLNLPAVTMGQPSESHLPGLNPMATIAIEHMFSTNLRTGKPFTDPNTFDAGGGTLIDPGTGQVAKGHRPVPEILDHIARQTPEYEILKDISYWIRYNQLGGQYDTGNIINPKFMLDPKTGQLKYPKDVATNFLSILGASITQINELRDMQDKAIEGTESAFGQRYNRSLVETPGFEEFTKGELEKMKKEGTANLTKEEKRRIFKEALMKATRPRQ